MGATTQATGLEIDGGGERPPQARVTGCGVIAVLDNAQEMDSCSCDLVKVYSHNTAWGDLFHQSQPRMLFFALVIMMTMVVDSSDVWPAIVTNVSSLLYRHNRGTISVHPLCRLLPWPYLSKYLLAPH